MYNLRGGIYEKSKMRTQILTSNSSEVSRGITNAFFAERTGTFKGNWPVIDSNLK